MTWDVARTRALPTVDTQSPTGLWAVALAQRLTDPESCLLSSAAQLSAGGEAVDSSVSITHQLHMYSSKRKLCSHASAKSRHWRVALAALCI